MRWRLTCASAGYLFVVVFLLIFLQINSNPIALGQIANGIFVSPLAGAPFMAISTVEQERIDADGSRIHLKSSRAFARDSRGRIYKEIRALGPFTQDDTPRLLMVVIYDPQTRIYTYLRHDGEA